MEKFTDEAILAMHKDMFVMLNEVQRMPQALEDLIGNNTAVNSFAKRHILLPFQKVCTRCFFIVKGALKVYEINDKGKENNIWLLKEQDVVTAPESFISQTPSMQAIEAMEKTICITLTYEAMMMIRRQFPEFEAIYTKLTEKYYLKKCNRGRLILLEDPEERYNLFLKEEPELAERCSGKDIASYLGIARETLSRIRNKR